MSLAFRIAQRELRGSLRTGLSGFRVFLICLALGVAAITAVGTLRDAIEAGLADQGAVILGGDAEMEFTYRFASDEEHAFMAEVAERVSEVVDFRSMIVTEGDQALTQVKAVDGMWPLYGAAVLQPAMPLETAFAGRDGLPGAVLDPLLIERLELQIGDHFRLGAQDFVLMAALEEEPDSAAGGFSLGPRSLVRTVDLAQSGLIAPGSLYESKYRLALTPGTDLAALEARAEAAFRDRGLRWTDSRNAAPGIERFIDRMASFLVLVGLAGLAVGGVGISSAIRAWLEGKTRSIATLKVLGAGSGLVFRIWLVQAAILTGVGVAIGLILGSLVPLLAGPLIEASLPFPARLGLSGRALAEGAFYGAMTALVFAILPLARVERIRVAALYREGASAGGWPRPIWLLVLVISAGLMIGLAALTSPRPWLALGAAGGVVGVLLLLALAAMGLRLIARRMARARLSRNRPGLRAALAAIGGPGSEAVPVILALGLGLSVLAAVGQIDLNLRQAIDRDLPERAPAFFFVDIQPDQITPFLALMDGNPAVTRRESAPMLRGVVTAINDRPAREVAGEHWVVRGDRGITYAAAMPSGTIVTEGAWWPEDYSGAPLVSFGAKEAAELGLKLGDRITVNVLGRDITASIASFRDVDFSNAGMGFVMVMNEAALKGAPHSHISTVYAPPEAEAAILRDVTSTWPNITAIRIREAVDSASEALSAIATATAWAAAGTLVTGFAVLIGAAAAGERGRAREAALLKVLGATRGRILGTFALRTLIMGAAAGVVAVLAGALAGWAVLSVVMDLRYVFAPLPALGIVLGGMLATLLAGLAFALRPLAARPAGILRTES